MYVFSFTHMVEGAIGVRSIYNTIIVSSDGLAKFRAMDKAKFRFKPNRTEPFETMP